MRQQARYALRSTDDIEIFVARKVPVLRLRKLDALEPEGPCHEMYGYMGIAKDKNYVLTVASMTHRENPWIMNSFTGVNAEYVTSPQSAAVVYSLRKAHPEVVDYESPHDSHGIVYISIRKTAPHQAMEIAKPLARVTIVVDDDIDVGDSAAVRFAVGSRWQPALATRILESASHSRWTRRRRTARSPAR